MNNKVGEIRYNNFGSKMEIIKYNKSNDIDVYFEEYDWVYKSAEYGAFKKGQLKCPYEPRVYGKGYIGEGNYTSRINGKKTKCYETWIDMLKRCYNEKRKVRDSTYENCEVYDKFLCFQNFAKWYNDNYYEIKGEKMCLDKDILFKGNKVYSPETCIFVPNRINVLFIKSNKTRGDCPIGVSYNKSHKKYTSYMNYIDKKIYLGDYKTPEEAFQAYKVAKEKYIKEVADEYKPYIPKELYDAMYRYEVEIDD